MLMMKERRPAFRTIEGWVRSILIEADAIRECEEHGWMRDRADPHARVRALELAREHPPLGISPDEATAVEDLPRVDRRYLPGVSARRRIDGDHQRTADVPSAPSIWRPISAMAR